jgi:hypothetical protein
MGYTTTFEGSFAVTPPLTPEHACYLARFSGSRRMARDESNNQIATMSGHIEWRREK